MGVILLPVKWQYTLVNLDHIVLFSRFPIQHIVEVRQVLRLLRKAEVTMKLKMYSVFTNTIDSLGHAIQPRRLKIALHTIDVIKKLKPPKHIPKLRSFLGLCNAFRRLVL